MIDSLKQFLAENHPIEDEDLEEAIIDTISTL